MRQAGPFVAALLLLTAGALAFRTQDLGNRPMHGDEAVHAFKFRELWEQGVYRYDPNEFHGPTLYYAALPSVWLQGRRSFAETREADYRLPIALFGGAMTLLLLPLADGLGRRSALWAGLLLAVSPSFVFYSRDYIQEILLVFFTLGAFACGWRWRCSRRPGWLLGVGLCSGLMAASKETAVLSFLASGAAAGLAVLWTRKADGRPSDPASLPGKGWIAAAAALGLLTAALFLSGHGTNMAGPVDYLRSYTPWLQRAHGTSLHGHSPDYYLRLMLWTGSRNGPPWSEGLIVGLALVGGIAALLPERRRVLEGHPALARFLVFYTPILTVAYSVIPYKTPWLVLNLLLGMALLAGIGISALLAQARSSSGRAFLALLLLAGCWQLGGQAYRASYVYMADPRNPYVYAQPTDDIAGLSRRVAALSGAHPEHERMVIKVISVDEYYWPVPWYLRQFTNVGYWTKSVPADPDAPVILSSPEYEDVLTRRLDATHLMTGFFAIRPSVFLQIWVRMDLWKAYLGSRRRQPGQDL